MRRENDQDKTNIKDSKQAMKLISKRPNTNANPSPKAVADGSKCRENEG